MNSASRLAGAVAVAAGAVGLGVISAWPIYRSPWLLVVAAAGLVIGAALGFAVTGLIRRWAPPLIVLAVVAVFVVTVIPVAMPGSISNLAPQLGSTLGEGLAAVVLGWKQLLTLTLPVGAYRAVLVPAYLVFLVAAFVPVALRRSRFAPLAAVALLAPVAFGAVFGSSAVSASLVLSNSVAIPAPREIALWIAAAALGAAWVAWTASADRRAALRRLSPGRRGRAGARATRVTIGAGVLATATIVGLLVVPNVSGQLREVPRDRVEPEVVLRAQASPLAAYRLSKQDGAIDAPLFSVATSGDAPPRLRLAVLTAYDGVDFHAGVGSSAKAARMFGSAEAGRFTRFPAAGTVPDPVELEVTVGEGYRDIWVPTAGLGSLPEFSGPRADALDDSFYVDRETQSAIVVVESGSEDPGLAVGDAYRLTASASPDPRLAGRPAVDGSQLDAEAMPELAEWVQSQGQPATAEGLLELIDRLRSRGYLSHALSENGGDPVWLLRLAEQYGTVFWPSAGGHSLARIEQLFGQLNAQERRMAPVDPATASEQLVATAGDDEQFATAAALVARALGFDSRVVLGVRLAGAEEVPGVPNCARVCTGENLAAWIEVRGVEGVWVPIDTTPQLERLPSTLEEGQQLPEYPTTPEERDAQEVDPPIGVGDPDQGTDDATQPSVRGWLAPLLRGVGLGLLALVFLALPLIFLPFAKRLRAARRRGETDPELRAIGAWRELLDETLDAYFGASGPHWREDLTALIKLGSRREIAERVAGALDAASTDVGGATDRADRLRRVAAAVDEAVFSAEGITDSAADALWDEVDQDRAERRASRSAWRRILTQYSLRSYRVRLMLSRADAKRARRARD